MRYYSSYQVGYVGHVIVQNVARTPVDLGTFTAHTFAGAISKQPTLGGNGRVVADAILIAATDGLLESGKTRISP